MLSVQVHPPDERLDLIPKGETGKTEAWVVLEAEPGSRAYVGLKPGTTAADLRTLSSRTVDDCLTGFTPVRGQGILIEAGVVHALGEGVVVFEVQENSDVTFRLYDWDRIDPRSGLPRALQVEQAIDCVDFSRIVIQPEPQAIEATSPTLTRPFLDCPQFKLWRIQSTTPFHVGIMNIPRILVCIEGGGNIEYAGSDFPMEKGAVVLLPAVVGSCRFRPESHVTLLEIALPDHA
jgi:mannose-6-phosphate isomerase